MGAQMSFYLYRRAQSPFWYVRFRNSLTGSWLPGRSTRQTDRGAAFNTAVDWYRGTGRESAGQRSLLDTLTKAPLSADDLRALLDGCKARGLIAGYTLPGTGADVDAAALPRFIPGYSSFLLSWEAK